MAPAPRSWGVGYPRRLAASASLLIVLAAAFAGCGGEGSSSGYGSRDEATTTSGSGQTERVEIEGFAYKPATIRVPAGTEIVFTNRDAAPHTATSDDPGTFETDTIKEGKSDSVTLDEAGSFDFYCAFHPFMKGKVVVEGG
jgi:plastocyanin